MNKAKQLAWVVAVLIGGYIFLQALADVAATKLVDVGGLVIPAGTFVFTITFTLRDMIHKRLGKDWARAAIIMAAIFNVFMALYLRFVALLPSPAFVPEEVSAGWTATFALVPSIVIASITAELVSELIDTDIYHRVMDRFTGKMQFMRVLISNAVSLPIDSIIFGFLAFMLLPLIFGGTSHTLSETVSIAWGQIVWKAIVTVLSIPLIYLVKDKPLTW